MMRDFEFNSNTRRCPILRRSFEGISNAHEHPALFDADSTEETHLDSVPPPIGRLLMRAFADIGDKLERADYIQTRILEPYRRNIGRFRRELPIDVASVDIRDPNFRQRQSAPSYSVIATATEQSQAELNAERYFLYALSEIADVEIPESKLDLPIGGITIVRFAHTDQERLATAQEFQSAVAQEPPTITFSPARPLTLSVS